MCPSRSISNQTIETSEYLWRPWEPANSEAMGLAKTQSHITPKPHYSSFSRTSASSQLTCNICMAVFKRESELKRHKLSKHTLKRENCKVCSKVFTRKDNLTRHIKLAHSNENKPRCKYCTKSLSRKDAVGRHELTCSANPGKKTGVHHEDLKVVSNSPPIVPAQISSYHFESHSERLRMKMEKSKLGKSRKDMNQGNHTCW